jgi:ribosomal-protein-alanine N-acetyltransferase
MRNSIGEDEEAAGNERSATMKIRKFSQEDLPAILAIQEKLPQAPRWLEWDYASLAADPQGMLLVAELETMTPPKVLGFVAFRRVIDQAELYNLAVDPAHQEQGVGRALLEEARRRLLEAGAKRVFLEVRTSNKPALGLYSSIGFSLQALRKDYYREPREDAYVMRLELAPPNDRSA